MSSPNQELLSAQRFYSKIRIGKRGCWLWLGYVHRTGYGHITRNQSKEMAHRFSYEKHIGPIPKGYTLDHLCRVRRCVNPFHLKPITLRENVMKGNGWCAKQARKMRCKHGHAFNAENTYLWKYRRGCRKCNARIKREAK